MTVLQLVIVPDAGTEEQNHDGSGELAWEHATTLARQVGIDIGGEQFVEVYNGLLEKYRFCGQHYGFIQHLALRVLHELLHTGQVALLTNPKTSPQEATHLVQNLATVVTSAMMWMYVCDETSWVPNEQWDSIDPDHRGVTFTFELQGETNADD